MTGWERGDEVNSAAAISWRPTRHRVKVTFLITFWLTNGDDARFWNHQVLVAVVMERGLESSA